MERKEVEVEEEEEEEHTANSVISASANRTCCEPSGQGSMMEPSVEQ
jgi:hypothetical protein